MKYYIVLVILAWCAYHYANHLYFNRQKQELCAAMSMTVSAAIRATDHIFAEPDPDAAWTQAFGPSVMRLRFVGQSPPTYFTYGARIDAVIYRNRTLSLGLKFAPGTPKETEEIQFLMDIANKNEIELRDSDDGLICMIRIHDDPRVELDTDMVVVTHDKPGVLNAKLKQPEHAEM
jgi:hypothetical protein